jgi:hypothetical protein
VTNKSTNPLIQNNFVLKKLEVGLAYVVIGLVMPWFGLDLFDLARVVAAADLPGTVLAWFTGAPTH